MPITKRQYRKVVINVEFEWSGEHGNEGWLVECFDDFPWELYDYVDQDEIDRECERDD